MYVPYEAAGDWGGGRGAAGRNEGRATASQTAREPEEICLGLEERCGGTRKECGIRRDRDPQMRFNLGGARREGFCVVMKFGVHYGRGEEGRAGVKGDGWKEVR